jgi:hypothetical protein
VRNLLLSMVFLICGLSSATSAEVPSAPPPPVIVESIQPGSPSDRALTILEGLATRTEAFVQKSAPEVWRIHLTQVKYEAATIWIGPLCMVVISLLSLIVALKLRRLYLEKAQDCYDKRQSCERPYYAAFLIGAIERAYYAAFFIGAIALVVLVVGSGIFCNSLIESSRMSGNPEYYALERVLGKME